MSDFIRIVVVDDHLKIHRAISALIEVTDDIEIIGYASNGQEAVALCDELRPDAVLMDILMPIMDGIEATRIILNRNPSIRVIALSSYIDDNNVRDILKAGAAGFLLKTAPLDDLPRTIRTTISGMSVISSELTQMLLGTSPAPAQSHTAATYGLTQRELEVLSLMVKGLNNNEIARMLTVSLSTIKFHVSSIISKLNVTNRVEAATLAVEKRLIPS
jgi:two-component system, NarL family, response regulator LiaR